MLKNWTLAVCLLTVLLALPGVGRAQEVVRPAEPAPQEPGTLSLVAPDDAIEPAAIGDRCVVQTTVSYSPPAPQNTLVGAFYYPWHRQSGECPANSWWCNCIWGPKPQHPEPALGFYDSGSRTVVDAHMDQMKQHGVDVVAIEWTGRDFIEANTLDAVVPSLSAKGMKFVLLYDLAIRHKRIPIPLDDPNIRQDFIGDFAYFATNYFQRPEYLKLANRPVIYVYLSRRLDGTTTNQACGNKTCIAYAFDQARQAARNAGFADLYIVADQLWWPNGDGNDRDYGKLALMRAQALSPRSVRRSEEW